MIPEENDTSSRRRILQGLSGSVLGSIAFAGGAGASGFDTDSGNLDDLEYEQVRGSARNPISTERISALQEDFTERTLERTGEGGAFLNVESTFADEKIIAYNIILDYEDKPREQFVTVGSGRPITTDSTVSRMATRRRHRQADEMLEHAVDEEERLASTNEATTNGNWDIDWDEWSRRGGTEVYWEPEEEWSYNAKVGNVKFIHNVRKSLDHDRIGARSKIRMEPGRQICNDGMDAYCTSSIQDGFSNKQATVHHDWDQWVNEVPKDELIVSTDPEGQISDVTGTRGYSLGLELAREPSLSVGFNSSVSFPGAQLLDATTLSTGRSEHRLEMNSADSSSASQNAVFEVGSVAEYEKRCTTSPPLTQDSLVEIDVDLEWGLNVPVGNYGHTESTTKSFEYTTWC